MLASSGFVAILDGSPPLPYPFPGCCPALLSPLLFSLSLYALCTLTPVMERHPSLFLLPSHLPHLHMYLLYLLTFLFPEKALYVPINYYIHMVHVGAWHSSLQHTRMSPNCTISLWKMMLFVSMKFVEVIFFHSIKQEQTNKIRLSS